MDAQTLRDNGWQSGSSIHESIRMLALEYQSYEYKSYEVLLDDLHIWYKKYWRKTRKEQHGNMEFVAERRKKGP